jgi:hypothetical protein
VALPARKVAKALPLHKPDEKPGERIPVRVTYAEKNDPATLDRVVPWIRRLIELGREE